MTVSFFFEVPEEELLAFIILSRCERISLRKRLALLGRYHRAVAVLDVLDEESDSLGLSRNGIPELRRERDFAGVANEVARWRAEGVTVVTFADARYPARLREIATPPLVLYARGDLELIAPRHALAVVGSRHMTVYGESVVSHFIPKIAASGVAIVSGLANGIDAMAHRKCLDIGGKTIAVQAQGVGCGYPRGNQHLYEEIVRCGLVLSEFVEPPAYMGREMFPRRNRIVSGLCDGVLVVEAKAKSGSLVTARFALEQNRDVYAVPGSVFSETSRGCLDLIREGAKPARDFGDILEDFTLLNGVTRETKAATEVSNIARAIFSSPMEEKIAAICATGTTIDDIVEKCATNAAEVIALVTKMELEGVLSREIGGRLRVVS